MDCPLTEIWRDVPGSSIYEVSSFGRIRNKVKNHILHQSVNKAGYAHVELRYGYNKHVLIHRVVASAFCSNPHAYNIVNHKDENKLNNYADNLEWCSQKHNVNYGNGYKTRFKRINQIDENGVIVNTWDSIKDASEKLGIHRELIGRCVRHERKQTHGFAWEYA